MEMIAALHLLVGLGFFGRSIFKAYSDLSSGKAPMLAPLPVMAAIVVTVAAVMALIWPVQAIRFTGK